jgi:hypothetical protein
MRIFLPIIVLAGCNEAIEPGAYAEDADPQPMSEVVRAIQPAPLVELVEHTAMVVGTEADCPRVTVLESKADEIHERWEGGCTLADGSSIEGVLERFDGPDTAWLTGHSFRLEKNGRTTFGLDGAIEITAVDSLWLVDVAASVCGLRHWGCSEGFLGLDLTSTIFPAETFPENYDITVSGAVATDRNTLTLDGAWSVDQSICEVEPTSGMLSIRMGEHHAIELDGAIACDGCASWQVQGQPTPGLCGLAQ